MSCRGHDSCLGRVFSHFLCSGANPNTNGTVKFSLLPFRVQVRQTHAHNLELLDVRCVCVFWLQSDVGGFCRGVDGVGHRVASICVMRCVGQLLCSWLSRMRDRIRFSFCFGVVFVTEVLCLVPLRVSTSFSRARMQRFRKCRM